MSASNVVVLKIKSMWKNGIPELRVWTRLRNNLILFFSVNAANIFTAILLSGDSPRRALLVSAGKRPESEEFWGAFVVTSFLFKTHGRLTSPLLQLHPPSEHIVLASATYVHGWTIRAAGQVQNNETTAPKICQMSYFFSSRLSS